MYLHKKKQRKTRMDRRGHDRIVVFTAVCTINAYRILFMARSSRCNLYDDEVCQWLEASTPFSSTNKTVGRGIAEILLNVVLNTITLTLKTYWIQTNRVKHWQMFYTNIITNRYTSFHYRQKNINGIMLYIIFMITEINFVILLAKWFVVVSTELTRTFMRDKMSNCYH
jgi:hypothetical protein